MTTLTIRSLTDSTITAALVRDVSHVHPEWVHAQLGTASETELQSLLDCSPMQEFIDAAAAGRTDEEKGISYTGPLYRLTSSYQRGGVDLLDDSAESLGDYYGRHWADPDEAQEAADRLTADQDDDDDMAWQYEIRQVR